MEIVKPTLEDIALMQELVNDEVKQGLIIYRDADEMATNIRSYLIVKDKEKIIAFVALHIYTTTLAEVRSLVVKKEYRGQGIAKKLINAILEEAKKLKLKQCLVLTYEKTLFEKMGFKEIPKEEIPNNKIWLDCIKCKHFPVCNEISLIKDL